MTPGVAGWGVALRAGRATVAFDGDARYEDVLRRWLPRLVAAPLAGGEGVRFTLVTGRAPATPRARPTLQHGAVRMWRQDGRVVMAAPGGLLGSVDLEASSGTLCAPDHEASRWTAVHHLLRPLIHLALGRLELFAMHAAAVSFGSRALVVLGATGAGKSTLAARLAAEGARVLSDDVTLLDGRDLTVVGLADRTRLASYPVPAEVLDRDPDGKLPGLAGETSVGPAQPALLLFLDASLRPAPFGVPLRPADAMARLLHSWLLTLDPVNDGVRLEALRALAAQCRAVELTRGPVPPATATLRRWMEAAAA